MMRGDEKAAYSHIHALNMNSRADVLACIRRNEPCDEAAVLHLRSRLWLH